MKVNVRKFQVGGEVPTQDPQGGMEAPAQQTAPEAGGEDQMMAQLQQIAAEIIQQLGPDAAAMLAQMILEMIQGGAVQQEAAPTFQRRGGKIQRIR